MHRDTATPTSPNARAPWHARSQPRGHLSFELCVCVLFFLKKFIDGLFFQKFKIFEKVFKSKPPKISAEFLVFSFLIYLFIYFSWKNSKLKTKKLKTKNYVNHRQHSCLGLCLGTPNSDTRDELEIHLHTRGLTVVIDLRVPLTSPSGLDTDFAPRSSRQVSQVVALSWPCLVGPQGLSVEPRSCPLFGQFPCPGHQLV